MKQNLKKLLALLLVLAMVFSLAACKRQTKNSGDIAPESEEKEEKASETQKPEETEDESTKTSREPEKEENTDPSEPTGETPVDPTGIIGDWTADVSAGAFLNGLQEQLGADTAQYFKFDEIFVHLHLTLFSDFTYSLEVDKDAVEQTKADLNEVFRVGLIAVAVNASGVTEEELRAAMKLSGKDLDAEIEKQIEDNIDVDQLVNTKVTGSFWFEDGKLYYTIESTEKDPNQYAIIQFNVGQFTVVEMSEGGQIQIDKAFLPIIFNKG